MADTETAYTRARKAQQAFRERIDALPSDQQSPQALIEIACQLMMLRADIANVA